MSISTFMIVAATAYTVDFTRRMVDGYVIADRTQDAFDVLSSHLAPDKRGKTLSGVLNGVPLHLTKRALVVHRRRTMALRFEALPSLSRLEFSLERYRKHRGRDRTFFYSWRGEDRVRGQQLLLRSRAAPQWAALAQSGDIARISANGQGALCVNLFWTRRAPEATVRLIERAVAFAALLDEIDSELPLVELDARDVGSASHAPSGAPVPAIGFSSRKPMSFNERQP